VIGVGASGAAIANPAADDARDDVLASDSVYLMPEKKRGRLNSSSTASKQQQVQSSETKASDNCITFATLALCCLDVLHYKSA
jgi:hypothetical protein